MGPISQPKNVAANVRMPMDITGSRGMSLVISSAISGCVERKTKAEPVTMTDETMLLANEKRRRDVRRRKNAFQSRTVFAGGCLGFVLTASATVEACLPCGQESREMVRREHVIGFDLGGDDDDGCESVTDEDEMCLAAMKLDQGDCEAVLSVRVVALPGQYRRPNLKVASDMLMCDVAASR